jgi:hypothetical protein
MSVKFPVKVYTFQNGSDYYDMSEDEMKDKCCIYGCMMYFYDSLPEQEQMDIDEYSPTLYDMMNYESTAWWTWSQEHLIALYKSESLNDKYRGYILEHLSKIAAPKIECADG